MSGPADEAPQRSRPIAQFPRGPRRRWATEDLDVIVPLRSPQRSAHELRVLMKPHDWTRSAVQHRAAVDAGDPAGEQPWADDLAERLVAVASEAASRLGATVEAVEAVGEERLRLRVKPDTAARGVALCCSAASPELWLTLGRLAVRGRQFWRRERGRKPNYRVAKDVGLTREDRALLRDLLRPR